MKRIDWFVSVFAGMLLGGILLSIGLVQNLHARAATDTENIRTLLLNSHHSWNTLLGEAKVVWYSQNGNTQTYTMKFSIVQPTSAYIDTTSIEGNGNDGIWISDGSNSYTLDKETKTYYRAEIPAFTRDLTGMPETLLEVDEGAVYGHPFALIIPSPIKEYIYPSWFAEAGGKYFVVGKERILGRDTWIVDYRDIIDDVVVTHQKAWIDQETGVILKFVQFNINDDWIGDLFEEFEFTSLAFDESIDPAVFSLPDDYTSAE